MPAFHWGLIGWNRLVLVSLKGWCTWHKTWLQMMMLGPLSRVMMVRQPFCAKNMQTSHFLCAKFSPARAVLYLQLNRALLWSNRTAQRFNKILHTISVKSACFLHKMAVWPSSLYSGGPKSSSEAMFFVKCTIPLREEWGDRRAGSSKYLNVSPGGRKTPHFLLM